MRKDLHILGKLHNFAVFKFNLTGSSTPYVDFEFLCSNTKILTAKDNCRKFPESREVLGVLLGVNKTYGFLRFILFKLTGGLMKLQLTPAKSLETKQTSKAQAIQNSRNIRLAEKCQTYDQYLILRGAR